jgi:DNA topoisomerase-1
VKHGKTNATIPRDRDPQEVTLDEAVELIAARVAKQAAGKSPAEKKAPAKKKAAAKKKPTAKKKAPAKKKASTKKKKAEDTPAEATPAAESAD